MVDYVAGVHVLQRLKRQPVPFFFLIDPGGEGLFDDPSPGPLKPARHLIDLFGKRCRDVCCKHFRFHIALL
jgi:hypothetical protein